MSASIYQSADIRKFQDKYYLDPSGGQQASLDLQSRVRDYLEDAEPSLSRLPIVVRAFANVDGMSKFLLHTGLVRSFGSLSEFAKKFSQASAMSDFVLVGHGKDRADKKIKGEIHILHAGTSEGLSNHRQVCLSTLSRIQHAAISCSEPATTTAM